MAYIRLTKSRCLNGRKSACTTLCKCSGCGIKKEIQTNQLKTTQFCRKCCVSKRNTKHGLSGTAIYNAYFNAKDRCENPNHAQYNEYGGRGIKFLFASLEEWTEALGNKPDGDFSVDRIDTNGNYEIGNIEWTSRSTQQSNQRKRNNSMNPAKGVQQRNRKDGSFYWEVKYTLNYKQYYVGCYNNLEDAKAAYANSVKLNHNREVTE